MRQALRTLLGWLSLGLLLSACGCILGQAADSPSSSTKPKTADTTVSPGARVAAAWQKQMLTTLETDKNGYDEAYGVEIGRAHV